MAQGKSLRGFRARPHLPPSLGPHVERRRQQPVLDPDAGLQPAVLQRRLCTRARPWRRGPQPDADFPDRVRAFGRGPERGRRSLPGRRRSEIPSHRLSRRNAQRAQHGAGQTRVGQPARKRNRELAHRGPQQPWRTGDRFPPHQSSKQKEPSSMSYITEERKLIQQMARDFALEQVLPIANKLDPEQGDIPMSLRDKMAELGYFGILIPEEYGGLGLGVFEYALVTEELARAWMSVASIIARGNSLWGGVTEEDKRRYFPKIARGEWLGAFSLSEPDAGSDLASVACKATRQGDEWVINGTKTWCTFADGADYIVLFARTSPPT